MLMYMEEISYYYNTMVPAARPTELASTLQCCYSFGL